MAVWSQYQYFDPTLRTISVGIRFDRPNQWLREKGVKAGESLILLEEKKTHTGGYCKCSDSSWAYSCTSV